MYALPAQLQEWQSHRGGAAQEPVAWNARCLCTGGSHWLPARRAQTAQQHVPDLACCSTCSSPLPPPYICNTTSFAAALAQVPCHFPKYATRKALSAQLSWIYQCTLTHARPLRELHSACTSSRIVLLMLSLAASERVSLLELHSNNHKHKLDTHHAQQLHSRMSRIPCKQWCSL